MTHDELREELQGFADSTDGHITTEDAVLALGLLVERIENEGLHPSLPTNRCVKCGATVTDQTPSVFYVAHDEQCDGVLDEPESHVAEEAPRPLQENLALSSQSRESTGANRVSVEGRGQSISDARHSDPEPDDIE